MKRKIIILSIFICVAILVASGFFIWRYYAKKDIVIEVNISENYRTALTQELDGYFNELLSDPNNLEILTKVGIIQRKLGLLSQSERTFFKVLPLFNDQEKKSNVYLYLAQVYRDMGDYKKADLYLRISTETNFSNAPAFLELIDLYKKHYPDKANELDNIYRAGSDYAQSPEIWASYAKFLEDRGEYRQARIYWQEVFNFDPENEEAYESYVRLGELLGAEN